MNEKRELNKVTISKPVETTNQQLDLELFSKLISVTNVYNIDYKLDETEQTYIMRIHFLTDLDILELIKLFGKEYDIKSKPLDTRRLQ